MNSASEWLKKMKQKAMAEYEYFLDRVAIASDPLCTRCEF
jgi:hypothetical protein